MGLILTACVPLLLMAAALRGLKHGFYALHILFTAALCGWAQVQLPLPLKIFSREAAMIALAAHLLSVNLVTWLACAADRRAQRNNASRIPTRTLQAFMLIGGMPSAWLAQRRDAAHPPFQRAGWLLFLLQLSELAVLLYSAAQ